MKNLKNLKGAKTLSKNEQKVIKGGEYPCPTCAQVGALGCNYRNCM